MTNHLVIDSSLDFYPIKNKLATDYLSVYPPGIQDIINCLCRLALNLFVNLHYAKYKINFPFINNSFSACIFSGAGYSNNSILRQKLTLITCLSSLTTILLIPVEILYENFSGLCSRRIPFLFQFVQNGKIR